MKQETFEFQSIIYQIFIGQNKQDNFDIIDMSLEHYIWFHVEHEPSCHVILQVENPLHKIPLQVLKRCAYLCKINSKAKNKKSTIIYTPIKNVKKTNIIGQVLAFQCKTINI